MEMDIDIAEDHENAAVTATTTTGAAEGKDKLAQAITEALSKLSRKEIQDLAKKHSIKANASTVTIIVQLSGIPNLVIPGKDIHATTAVEEPMDQDNQSDEKANEQTTSVENACGEKQLVEPVIVSPEAAATVEMQATQMNSNQNNQRHELDNQQENKKDELEECSSALPDKIPRERDSISVGVQESLANLSLTATPKSLNSTKSSTTKLMDFIFSEYESAAKTTQKRRLVVDDDDEYDGSDASDGGIKIDMTGIEINKNANQSKIVQVVDPMIEIEEKLAKDVHISDPVEGSLQNQQQIQEKEEKITPIHHVDNVQTEEKKQDVMNVKDKLPTSIIVEKRRESLTKTQTIPQTIARKPLYPGARPAPIAKTNSISSIVNINKSNTPSKQSQVPAETKKLHTERTKPLVRSAEADPKIGMKPKGNENISPAVNMKKELEVPSKPTTAAITNKSNNLVVAPVSASKKPLTQPKPFNLSSGRNKAEVATSIASTTMQPSSTTQPVKRELLLTNGDNGNSKPVKKAPVKFDLKASLQRPITWEMKKGSLNT